ncbi:MAG: class I SAM-dependent methyltransferase [Acidimicrobiales bacterium]
MPERGDAARPGSEPASRVITWHHRLVARWWANFNTDGPEIDHFRADVEAAQPGLDVGCGSGRLLVPWVAAGLDVDGVDPAADMIAACREAARAVGREPLLAVQAAHELDLPRRYGAAVLCGSFGLGVTRAEDLEGLRRVRAHLRPGGVLALDYEVNELRPDQWRSCGPGQRTRRRRNPPNGASARTASYAIRHRITELDADESRMHRELAVWQWRGDELVANESHALVVNVYSREQIVAALGEAGFGEIRVTGGYHGGEPTEHDRLLVYRAVA